MCSTTWFFPWQQKGNWFPKATEQLQDQAESSKTNEQLFL